MRTQTISEVIVYHDETKEKKHPKLKGHVFLCVPNNLLVRRSGTLWGDEEHEVSSWKLFYNEIMTIRKIHNAFHKFHFSEISGKKWTKYDEATRQVAHVGVDALRCKRPEIFEEPICCKLAIILYSNPKPTSLKLYGGDKKEQRLRYDETLMRMLLKGAVHLLYNENNKVRILKIISDGYPYHRRICSDRILWRLIMDDLLGESPLRGYVEIPTSAEIIHQSSQHKKFLNDSEEYAHANMLQLADMLLGACIYSCYKNTKLLSSRPQLGSIVDDKKGIISYPVRKMLDKRKRGKNFRYSGHYNSFLLSRASIINNEWEFEDVTPKEITIKPDTGQLMLFDVLE